MTAKLVYIAIASLDGYIEDADGSFTWAEPYPDLLAHVNALVRPIGTYLYGRRMYETMVFWETVEVEALDPGSRDFTGIWRQADKIVYSRTLQNRSSSDTQIVREFDADAVRKLKESSARDITVGGADLARQAMAAGLVDECHLFLHPIIVGGGKSALPDGVRIDLELLEQRRFSHGVVYLHYGVRN